MRLIDADVLVEKVYYNMNNSKKGSEEYRAYKNILRLIIQQLEEINCDILYIDLMKDGNNCSENMIKDEMVNRILKSNIFKENIKEKLQIKKDGNIFKGKLIMHKE